VPARHDGPARSGHRSRSFRIVSHLLTEAIACEPYRLPRSHSLRGPRFGLAASRITAASLKPIRRRAAQESNQKSNLLQQPAALRGFLLCSRPSVDPPPEDKLESRRSSGLCWAVLLPRLLRAVHWVVERAFAWLNQFRPMRVRYDKRADIYILFLSFRCTLICWRSLRTWARRSA
jgi:hypothetical protein